MIGWRGLVVMALVALVAASACGRAATPQEGAASARRRANAPALRLVGSAFRFRVALYHPERPALDVGAELRRLAAPHAIAVLEGDSEDGPPDQSVVRFMMPTIEQFPPPEAAAIEYFARGLDDADKRAVLASKAVTALEFIGPGARATEDYRRALLLARDLAAKIGGYLMDDESRDLFTVRSFAERVAGFSAGHPNVSRHVTLHVYRHGALLRIVSLGMVKFALPDVAVDQVAGSSANSMATLVNAVCQTLAEQGQVELRGVLRVSLDEIRETAARGALTRGLAKGALRTVELELAPAAPDEGDADNRLLAIAFPGPAERLQQQHRDAIAALFGG